MKYEVEICDKLGLNKDLILKKSIRGLPGFNMLDLIEALVYTDTVIEAAEYLGYSDNPVKQAIKETLGKKFPERSQSFGGGGAVRDWRLELLLVIDHKYCNACNCILPLESFGVNLRYSSGKASNCKCCRNIQLTYRKEYIIDRTPKWAELDLIRRFYKNCPNNYQVDHIIPLKGKNVSGLHVLSNLQYLTTQENQMKSNTFIMEH